MTPSPETSSEKKSFPSRFKNVGISVGVALVLALLVRSTVAQTFVAATDTVSPEVPQGAHVLACKICRTVDPGDIVVFEEEGTTLLARVTKVDEVAGTITVAKNNQPAFAIKRDDIIGRVVAQSR